jgi:hypothetical protein
MKGKSILGSLLVLLLVTMWALPFSVQEAKAATITVPDDYSTIQEAMA